MPEVNKTYVSIGAKVDQLKSDLNKGKSELEKFGRQTRKVAFDIAGAFGIAFGVREIIRFTGEVSKLAGEAEGVETAFNRITTPGLLDELRTATKGTVSDLELMKNAVRASNFKIPLEQLGSLLKFAQVRAKETGESVDYLVNSIVTGIGRKSPLILDNLGISAVELRSKLHGVGMESASVGDITKAVGDIATESLKKSGDQALTAAEKTAQLAAEWDNAKVEIGKFVNVIKNSLIPTLNDVATTLGNLGTILSSKYLTVWEKLVSLVNPQIAIQSLLIAKTSEQIEAEKEKSNAIEESNQLSTKQMTYKEW